MKDVLPEEKTIVACFPEDAGFAEACFKIPYDKLVVAVGCAALCCAVLRCARCAVRAVLCGGAGSRCPRHASLVQ